MTLIHAESAVTFPDEYSDTLPKEDVDGFRTFIGRISDKIGFSVADLGKVKDFVIETVPFLDEAESAAAFFGQKSEQIMQAVETHFPAMFLPNEEAAVQRLLESVSSDEIRAQLAGRLQGCIERVVATPEERSKQAEALYDKLSWSVFGTEIVAAGAIAAYLLYETKSFEKTYELVAPYLPEPSLKTALIYGMTWPMYRYVGSNLIRLGGVVKELGERIKVKENIQEFERFLEIERVERNVSALY